MGGRGSSGGVSASGKPYGSEFKTLVKESNIKFVKANNGLATAPMETMTRGRVYVTVNEANQLKFISYYDTANKRTKQIDLDKPHKGISPHTHHGYNHSENDSAKGYANLTAEEKRLVDKINRIWHNRRNNKS